MASFVARQALVNLKTTRFGPVRQNTRYFHNSSVVYKKSKVIIDDLFADSDEGSGDLFGEEPTSQESAASTSTSATLNAVPIQPEFVPTKKKLSPEERRERYNKLLEFLKPRVGRKPEVKLPQVRNSAWVNLVGLANTEVQLRELAGLFPSWNALGRDFDSHFSELFVRRCEKLSCPLLALEVFGNYAKHNLKLTLPGARQLLHSLHVEHPIDKVIAASALYSVYSLTPIAQDLVSCSMLISACLKNGSKDSLKVARTLVPHLRRMVSQAVTVSASSPPPTESTVDRTQAWLQWSLKKVDKALFVQNGSRAEWLRDWRMRSGHTLEPNQF
ncbi:hypothetical protein AX15_002711 [Amanita polypyramis BW_CC]|nr:hypothetical protein AX15_002711 [Amanita polypyramis BW_CC]